jgi:DNA mismatch repair protein MutH
VYYAAHHFKVASKEVSTLQKDLMHNRGRVGSLTHVELGTVTGSKTLLQFKGVSWKLALMVAKGLRRFKE